MAMRFAVDVKVNKTELSLQRDCAIKISKP